MSAQSFLDACAFTPTASGSSSPWTVSAVITGYMTPATAGAVDGATYSYRAESSDKSQWEVGHGVCTAAGTTLTRVPLFSSNSNAAVSFTAAPNIYLTQVAEDMPGQILLASGLINSATASLTLSLPAGYNQFLFQATAIDGSATTTIKAKLSSDNGATYYTGGTDYPFVQTVNGAASSGAVEALYGPDFTTTVNQKSFWEMLIDPCPTAAYYPSINSRQTTGTTGSLSVRQISQWLAHAVTVNKIQIFMASGNITNMRYGLWGVKI